MPPHFILPSPFMIALSFYDHAGDLFANAAITGVEVVLGFITGASLGIAFALVFALFPRFEAFTMPLMVALQALPVFAIAPLLVIWFGFGLLSKLVMATIIIFFPVLISMNEGLKSVSKSHVELSRFYKMSKFTFLRFIALPTALPSLFSGLKIAASLAPIAAIVGEWVGSSGGLGFLMLHANARMQTDQLFAALFVLLVMAMMFHFVVNKISALVLAKY